MVSARTVRLNSATMTKCIDAVWVIAVMVGCSSSSSSLAPAVSNASGSGVGAGNDGSTASGSATGKGANDGGPEAGDGSSSCGTPYGTGVGNGGTMSWDSGGTSECAFLVEATHATDSAMDFLEIVGSTSSEVAIDITVVSYAGPLGGTYSCATDAGPDVLVTFIYGMASLSECTITIAQAGSATLDAQGTFSAIGVADAGSVTITNGVFDVPVTVPDGG